MHIGDYYGDPPAWTWDDDDPRACRECHSMDNPCPCEQADAVVNAAKRQHADLMWLPDGDLQCLECRDRWLGGTLLSETCLAALAEGVA